VLVTNVFVTTQGRAVVLTWASVGLDLATRCSSAPSSVVPRTPGRLSTAHRSPAQHMTRHLGRASDSGLWSQAVTVPGRWPGAESRAHGVLTSGVPPMAQPRSRVDLYAAIRRDARSGMSNRALQRKHGVGFRTVTAALESAWPKERSNRPNAAHGLTRTEW
jgi:hypothetical protein